MVKRHINPEDLPEPKGYSNGVLVGKTLYVAGQPAFDSKKPRIVGKTVVEQFDVALGNFLKVVRAAGGAPEDVVRMLVFVKNIQEYKSKLKELGQVYRKHMGKEFPAMAVVEVSNLFDDGALIEIEGTAELD
jgi:enamine deaminase RidA (YjgF/YER057c/UK114 family)